MIRKLKFEVNKESFGNISLDNGEDSVVINRGDFEKITLEKNFSEENIKLAWERIMDYANRVNQEKSRGIHLGSTDLRHAVYCEIRDLGFSEEESEKFIKRFKIEN